LKKFDLSKLDTSKVTTMRAMLYNSSSLEYLGAINCSGIDGENKYPLQIFSTNSKLTYVGGFIGMKYNWSDNYGLNKYSNLTYESCINILNGLHDFTGNGETPTSSQGKLKVHPNFLTAVGDEISIGTNKGWTITA
jgi:surface protein